ncbi:MAG: acid phosphatase [Candidatus Kapabacteria bacterium]|nr:acid phosphatase [Candidatus Kapabacteria bacterium]
MMNRRHLLRTLALAGIGSVLPRPLSARAFGEGALRFMVLGDWGTGGTLQKQVAAGMAAVADKARPTAMLSVGDNIYNAGVESVDDPQWQTKFERVYAAPSLAVPWWAILGNHDYRGNVRAQIDYHQRNPRWNMPSTYWKTSFTADDAVTKVDVLGLDTQQLTNKASGWKDQLAWLEKTMGTSTATWRLVLGHHPIRSYGHYGDTPLLVRELRPLLDQGMADIYFCGHEHDLQVIQHADDSFLCAISGAGGGTRTTKQGTYSKFAASHGGFMSVEVSARRLDLVVHNTSGSGVYACQRERRSK